MFSSDTGGSFKLSNDGHFFRSVQIPCFPMGDVHSDPVSAKQKGFK